MHIEIRHLEIGAFYYAFREVVNSGIRWIFAKDWRV